MNLFTLYSRPVHLHQKYISYEQFKWLLKTFLFRREITIYCDYSIVTLHKSLKCSYLHTYLHTYSAVNSSVQLHVKMLQSCSDNQGKVHCCRLGLTLSISR